MISVIVYGRNDSHAYNVHKRVALSLNAFAARLDDADSEILFVDYNTPNEFPTLPEAIADTLTPAARVRTRVLRVRPAVHNRFAARTHLAVIEPVARNVALRRSNPRNRWILSTNADNVVVPRRNANLCALAAKLADGFYGLPRFEVPEGLWESVDRLDIDAVASAFRRWGTALRLDEVVVGESDVGFDNPGDFQLALRTDLFDIDGFDERMVHGWHVDHNLARRIGFRHGPPRSLGADFLLYHCAHARQATPTHRRGRTQNDPALYVHAVTADELPRQRDQWGCPLDDIEEIRLASGSRFVRAVEAVARPASNPSTVQFNSRSFGNFSYDAHHVLPFLLDLLSTHALTVVIGYAGVRRDTFDLLRKALAALGFVNRILIPEDLVIRLGVAGEDTVQPVDAGTFRGRPDVFVFEFGLVRDEAGQPRDTASAAMLEPDEETALEIVYEHFAALVECERRTAPSESRSSRRVIAVNAVHNRYQPLVERALNATPSPFTSRLRHGIVVREDGTTDSAEAAPLAEMLAKALGRPEPVSVQELSGLYGMLATIAKDRSVPERERPTYAAAAPLALAFLRQPQASELMRGEDIAFALEGFQALLRPTIGDLPDAAIVDSRPPPSARPLTGTGSTADWDDPLWLRWAREVADQPDAAAAGARTDWIWQRAHTLFAMDRIGLTGRDTRVLAVCELPERLLGPLSFQAGALDIVNVADVLGHAPAATGDRQGIGHWTSGALFRAAGTRLVAFGAKTTAEQPYDLLLLPHGAAFCQGIAGFVTILERLDPWLADGACITVGAEVILRGRLGQERPNIATAGTNGIGRILASRTGMAFLDGASDMTVARSDLRLVCDEGGSHEGQPAFAAARSGDILWPCLWVLRRAHATRPQAWAAAAADTLRLYLGDQRPMLRMGPLGQRRPDGIHATEAPDGGMVFFGPYSVLPEGRYEARLAIRSTGGSSRGMGRIRAEVARGDRILAATEAEIGGGWGRPQRLAMTFAVPRQLPGEPPPLLEIRCWSNGKAALTVDAVDLVDHA